MSVPDNLHPSFSEKTFGALKAERKVNTLTCDKTEALPGDTLFVVVPTLNNNEVIVPGSLGLLFNIDLSGGHANNFLVQNVTRALVERMIVKFGGTILEATDNYDVYKTFEDLFLSQETRDGMILEGIQSEDLCKIRSGVGDKKTSGVDTEEKLEKVFGKKYRISLDHQILTASGIFYPHALSKQLTFELTLAQASHVVKGSEPTQLKYKLTNIQLEYETINSPLLAEAAETEYRTGKAYPYTHVEYAHMQVFKKDKDTMVNIKVNSQRRSMKGILILFIEPYTAGARDSEKYVFPDLTEVKVAINGKPLRLYSEGIKGKDMWKEAERFFVKEKNTTKNNMNLTKFYTGDKYGLLIDMRTMRNKEMHGSGTSIVNSSQGVQLQIIRSAEGSGNVNCHVFVIADAQFNIQDRQLESVLY